MRRWLQKLRGVRWKPWAPLALFALAWWFYAAPTHVIKRIHGAVAEDAASGTSPLVAARVDFVRVNARLSGDLRQAARGRLDAKSFSHLFLYGWLPQQRRTIEEETVQGDAHAQDPAPGGEPPQARYTSLYHIRYKGLNRFMATYWDPTQTHEIVLTLERQGVAHRWYVTKVFQYNMCAYDFDCKQVTVADHPRR